MPLHLSMRDRCYHPGLWRELFEPSLIYTELKIWPYLDTCGHYSQDRSSRCPRPACHTFRTWHWSVGRGFGWSALCVWARRRFSGIWQWTGQSRGSLALLPRLVDGDFPVRMSRCRSDESFYQQNQVLTTKFTWWTDCPRSVAMRLKVGACSRLSRPDWMAPNSASSAISSGGGDGGDVLRRVLAVLRERISLRSHP